jgi:hypothetical protein
MRRTAGSTLVRGSLAAHPATYGYDRREGSAPRPQPKLRRSSARHEVARGHPVRPAQATSVAASTGHRDGGLHVLDDLPAGLPVTHRELEVIETYLAALVDESFGSIDKYPE